MIKKPIFILLIFLVMLSAYFYSLADEVTNPEWGINFSPSAAIALGLDPKTVFIALVNDLKPERIRIIPNQDSRLTAELAIEAERLDIDAGFDPSLAQVSLNPLKFGQRIGYYYSPFLGFYYRLKTGLKGQAIDIDLQAMPTNLSVSLDDQKNQMNFLVFEKNISLAKKTGIERHYLTGVEWWYWLAFNHGDWTMWERAKELLSSDR